MQRSLLSNRKNIQEKSMSLQKEINVIKHETEEGITNLQTELETTGNEVKTNTAERTRIAEPISSVKRDLGIISSELAVM